MNSSDYQHKFKDLFSQFIFNMEMLPPDVKHPDTTVVISDLCRFLRIARLYATLEVNPDLSNGRQELNEIVYFSDGEFDIDMSYSIKKTNQGGTASYLVSQKPGDAPWSEEELNNIYLFLTTFYVFNSRARSMDLCGYLTYHDSELGVYNIQFLVKTIAMLLAQQKASECVCCRFNLRKFTLINRILGRKNGTVVMRNYVHILSDMLGENSYICRLGGDNFVMIFPKEKLDLAVDYLDGAQTPTNDPETPFIKVSARAGYFSITDECHTPTDIIDRSIIALNTLKDTPGILHVIYDDEVKKKEYNLRTIEDNFLTAIDNEEFLVYYQPKVELRNYSLCGAEALCRWKHNGKLISPGEFIPFLEQSSSICTLDMYMLEHVCRDIRKWIDNGMDVVRISVNLSRVNLANQNLAEQIIGIIEKYDVPFKCIEIEITETTSELDLHELTKVVRRLHETGICTSIDDFGSGYSSINLIRDLPWDTMKIDKSFLPDHAEYNKKKEVVLKHTIAIAQELGLECMVEGVETTEHVAFLKDNNCYHAQGFCFDKPLPVEEFEDRLRTRILKVKA